MARAHARILSAIWEDPDWVSLSQSAQRLYMLLVSQKKLSLVGLLTYTPSRWARLAADTSLASVEEAIAELEASRFVLVDRDTDELLIRTLVKHDITSLANGSANSKLIMGLWRAWEAIESRQLRQVATLEIPDAIWASPRGKPPAEALQMRRSPRIDPPDPSTGSDQRSDQSIDPATDSLSTLHSPLVTQSADNKQPGNSRGEPPPEAAASDQPVRLSDDERQERLNTAIEVLVERELGRSPTRNGNRQRHADAVRRGKHNDHHLAGHQALVTDPTLTPSELADLLEPPSTKPDRELGPEAVASAERIREAEAETARRLAEQRQEPPDPELNLSGVSAARSMLPPRLRLVEGA